MMTWKQIGKATVFYDAHREGVYRIYWNWGGINFVPGEPSEEWGSSGGRLVLPKNWICL